MLLFNILRRIISKKAARFGLVFLGLMLSLPFRTVQQEDTKYGSDGLEEEGEEEQGFLGELPQEEGHCTERNVTSFEIVAVEWVEVYIPFVVIIWVMLASLAKIGEF